MRLFRFRLAVFCFFSYNCSMDPKEIISLLEKLNQHHILDHLRKLNPGQQEELLREARKLDLPLVFDLFRLHSSDRKAPKNIGKISPAPIIGIPKTAEDIRREEKACLLGESLIREGKMVILIVAGGQGSRLGFDGPKGKFPVSPLMNKPLFQLFAEAVKALCLRYKVGIPLVIMTSKENEEETKGFFKENHFWGLAPHVHFFSQGMLPTLTADGRLILSEATHFLVNPDGHGGSLKAFHESGLLSKLLKEGYSQLFYCQVDNPIVKIADSVFLGYHQMAEAEISTKVVRRQSPDEKVGIYGLLNGKPRIIEYSDFSPDEYRALDENGRIRHWAGNIAVHVISLSFIERLNRHGFALPYHRAVKDVEGVGRDGNPERTKGLKFESFVFDAIPLAERTSCMEVLREEEFSPVKNKEGMDSPETARKAMSDLHRRWLDEAGLEVAPGAKVEISPLFALDKEELGKKFKGKGVKVKEDLYLDEKFKF
jgi:UDP-N-acetylglucosamine/UDP-N-acetylgalactosamine diphosphorylase